jgi:hypothetical protein
MKEFKIIMINESKTGFYSIHLKTNDIFRYIIDHNIEQDKILKIIELKEVE